MSNLIIRKKNEIYLTITAEPHILQELSDHFTFEVPGAKFMPQYRNRYWDGNIRLFDLKNNTIYVGLLDKVVSDRKSTRLNSSHSSVSRMPSSA